MPYGDTTARNGYWMKGPGMEFINVLRQELPHIKFIAENLGHLSPEATELISASGIPGMRVLTYAFDETSLESVYFIGIEQEFASIRIFTGNEKLLNATFYWNYLEENIEEVQ